MLTASLIACGTDRAATGAAAGARRWLYGVTVDRTDRLARTLDSLRHLRHRPAVRLVLDVDRAHPVALAGYVRPARRLGRAGTLLAELVDSSELAHIRLHEVRRRGSVAVRLLHSYVDIWEVGNEVNGNWTGRPTAVARKSIALYRRVRAAGGRTALTLYYNLGCGDGPRELDPLAWSRRYLPLRMRAGLDYVLLSYYETQCHDRRPTPRVWSGYFRRLHAVFPAASLGFGEIGLPDPATTATRPIAASIIKYYYRLRLPLSYYVGGCFYWYYAQDMQPWQHARLWRTLNRSLLAP